MTLWRLRTAYWIPKATNTHLQHIILIAFQLHSVCMNAPQCYVIRSLPFLLSSSSSKSLLFIWPLYPIALKIYLRKNSFEVRYYKCTQLWHTTQAYIISRQANSQVGIWKHSTLQKKRYKRASTDTRFLLFLMSRNCGRSFGTKNETMSSCCKEKVVGGEGGH